MPKKVKDTEIENLTLDMVAVTGFQANMMPEDKQVFIINQAKGYEDKDGKFVPNKQLQQVAVHGEELQTFMGTKLADLVAESPDVTMYEALQAMMYSKI